MATKKPKKKTMAERHPMTIDAVLFKTWRSLLKKNDAGKIAEELGLSRPTVDKALKYGFVKSDELLNGINAYFKNKSIQQQNAAKEMESATSK